MRIRLSYYPILIVLIFSSCQSSEKETKESTVTSKAQFQLLFQDSIGFGSRGMEIYNEAVYLSGIKGNVYRVSEDFRITPYFNQHNDSLDYRDLCVLDQDNIIVCNSGSEAGYIFNIGQNMLDTLYFNKSKGVFLDDLILEKNGTIYCLGDPIDQKLFLLESIDSGKTWNRILDHIEIMDGEFFFAASGTCMSIKDDSIFFAIGGANSYVLSISLETGKQKKLKSSIPSNESSGINSVLVDTDGIYTVGGDYTQKDSTSISFESITSIGKQTSSIGYQSSISKYKNFVFCAGPNGIVYKKETDTEWSKLTESGYYKVIAHNGRLYCSGGKGEFAIYSIQFE
jgi:hypothetical protein